MTFSKLFPDSGNRLQPSNLSEQVEKWVMSQILLSFNNKKHKIASTAAVLGYMAFLHNTATFPFFVIISERQPKIDDQIMLKSSDRIKKDSKVLTEPPPLEGTSLLSTLHIVQIFKSPSKIFWVRQIDFLVSCIISVSSSLLITSARSANLPAALNHMPTKKGMGASAQRDSELLYPVQLATTCNMRKTRPSKKPLFKEASISHTAQLHKTLQKPSPHPCPHDLPGFIAWRLVAIF